MYVWIFFFQNALRESIHCEEYHMLVNSQLRILHF